MKKFTNIAAAAGLAALLSAPVYAVQTVTNQQTGMTYTQGRITMIQREGNQYKIQLDNGGYNYWVPVSTARAEHLQVGDVVNLSGYGRADGMNVSVVSPIGPYYEGAGTMIGMVESVNRHLNYVTVRDQASGQRFKVDVRNMDTRRSVNVWHLRAGDRIVVNGGWENKNTFQANTVNF